MVLGMYKICKSCAPCLTANPSMARQNNDSKLNLKTSPIIQQFSSQQLGLSKCKCKCQSVYHLHVSLGSIALTSMVNWSSSSKLSHCMAFNLKLPIPNGIEISIWEGHSRTLIWVSLSSSYWKTQQWPKVRLEADFFTLSFNMQQNKIPCTWGNTWSIIWTIASNSSVPTLEYILIICKNTTTWASSITPMVEHISNHQISICISVEYVLHKAWQFLYMYKSWASYKPRITVQTKFLKDILAWQLH